MLTTSLGGHQQTSEACTKLIWDCQHSPWVLLNVQNFNIVSKGVTVKEGRSVCYRKFQIHAPRTNAPHTNLFPHHTVVKEPSVETHGTYTTQLKPSTVQRFVFSAFYNISILKCPLFCIHYVELLSNPISHHWHRYSCTSGVCAGFNCVCACVCAWGRWSDRQQDVKIYFASPTPADYPIACGSPWTYASHCAGIHSWRGKARGLGKEGNKIWYMPVLLRLPLPCPTFSTYDTAANLLLLLEPSGVTASRGFHCALPSVQWGLSFVQL